MFETLSILPLGFWAVIVALVYGAVTAFRQMNKGTGLPLLAVLGTISAWYVGDAFYNDYPNNHAKLFTAGTLQKAWWQVAWFLAVFLTIVPPINRWMNHAYLNRRSGVMQIFKQGVGQPMIQKQLNALFRGCAAVWLFLLLIAGVVLKAQVVYYVFPFFGYHASPWIHGRVGSGFDFLAILGVYLNLLVASMFGVVAALATDRRIRYYALLFCLLTWPYFIFDRTRNSMLSIVVPGILCWVFLRLRGGMVKKTLVLLSFFLVVNGWMKFVIANRTDMSITAAIRQKGLSLAGEKKVHNEGLNMFEELCWISTFIDDGAYQVNWGGEYFAELVNPIPRAIWHNKPLIGLDYAKARGFGTADDTQGGVNTTISTGLIGQGVVNFGRILGPLASAFLMSLWVAWLARLDLNVQALGHLPLYSLGLILTFNLGRDITLITLYPFVFGALAVWWQERHQPHVTHPVPLTRTAAVGPGSTPPNHFPFSRSATTGGFVKRKPFRGAQAHPKRI